MIRSVNIRVQGIVQGVGFRPFAYALARAHGIAGWVQNDTEGVLIHATGDDSSVTAFIAAIDDKRPPLASIRSIDVIDTEPTGEIDFTIRESADTGTRAAFIPPDTALCEDCRREHFDTADPRLHYPFITCTHCGPRFSIIRDIPYDRANTAMAPFPMCPRCTAEYRDPDNRRFHTQPNACPICGPHLSLFDSSRTRVCAGTDEIARRVIGLIRDGAIVAIKGVGGYLLAADARNDAAVRALRERKGRPFKPFALMAGDIDIVESFLEVSDVARDLLLSRERPIVVLRERRETVSRLVAPGLSHVGVMLPYAPFQHLFFSLASDMVLIMTSGNLSEEPIVFDDDEAFERLGGIADYFVTYDRAIHAHSDDSVLFVADGAPHFIRRARGYVPVPFRSRPSGRHIIATGGDIKNAFALSKDDIVIVSQHLGDLESPAGNALFQSCVAHFRTIFDFAPDTVACDLHPGYFTTRIAEEFEARGMRRIGVQHHHAHIAAVMEEHDLDGPVIGIAFDGTGYGADGTLWGSEFLIATRSGFERAAHFDYVPLPGGESAIHEVWKIGVSMLHAARGQSLPRLGERPGADSVMELIEKRINSPLACSIGRLFDGAAAILGIADTVSCEAEAAMLLEEAALRGSRVSRPDAFALPTENADGIIISTAALTEYLLDLLRNGAPVDVIAYRFHETIADSAASVADMLRDRHGVNAVALSGGVFQNRLLLSLLLDRLRNKRFDVYPHRAVPSNDGCIALGQIAVAKERLRTGNANEQ
ncbi:MAG TPA: carbamoyltransferase HypF [Spirochaetota bacterium]|nr:carbamoyltransferase HypF [Spirochaetota bacterium]HNT12901.1 carbamoyltransferase HypF [Spirochaetota bacterium]